MRQRDFNRWVTELNAQEYPEHNLDAFAYLMQNGTYIGGWYNTQDVLFTNLNAVMHNN